jgi:hypothetical protein
MTRADAITEETRRYVNAARAGNRHLAHIHWLALSRLRGRAPWDLED